jgi:hypothetical protein
MITIHEAVEKLLNELIVLEQKFGKQTVFASDNGKDIITVYAPDFYKAYLPKKYEGFEVILQKWQGLDTPLSVDFEINLG